MTNGIHEKALSSSNLADTIQAPPPDVGLGGPGYITFSLAREADDIPAWGTLWALRDQRLRELWPEEPVLAGALATIAARNAAMTIKLDGPTRTVEAAQELFHTADLGAGLISLMVKLSLDAYTQDNGAFMELARGDYLSGDAALKRMERGLPLPPVTGLNHIDAAACIRTGDAVNPVIYYDAYTGARHLLPWHMVVPITEMPSPIRRMRGMQYCALTRVLKAAQFMRDVNIFRREKVGGRNPSEIHIVGGPQKKEIEDIMARAQERASNRGLLRYIEPLIIASLDPTRPVSTASIGWASLPDGFDYDTELKNYITLLALDLLEDYQTFAPLAGGGLGTSQQSVVLERKGRGKGPGLWQKLLVHIFNFYGILPRTVEFSFDETDTQGDLDRWTLINSQVDAIVKATQAGLVTSRVAQQIMADEGIILDEDYLAMLGEEDATPDETVTDETQIADTGAIPVLAAPVVPALPDGATPPNGAAPTPAFGGRPFAKFFQGFKGLSVYLWRALRPRYKAVGDIGEIVGDFEAAVTDAVDGYMDGRLTRARAQRAFEGAITSAWLPAAEQGYEDGGGEVSELDADDLGDIRAGERAQVEYARDFWAALPDIRNTGGDADLRAGLYVQSLRGWYADWKLRGAGNKALTWNLGNTEVHCEPVGDLYGCAELAGQRHPAKWYRKRGLNPRTPGSKTKCQGFHCDCSLTDDDGEEYTL